MRGSWLMFALGTGALSACSQTADPPAASTQAKPEPEPEPKPVDPRYAAFTFGHTMSLFRPEGAEVMPIAEMGDATQRAMKAVIAIHRQGELSLALWTFRQLDDDTLAPAGAPKPLLPLTKEGDVDADAIDALRVQMTAPRSVVTRPQGVEAASAVAAVALLAGAAATVRDAAASARARTEALALFARGLDDQQFFARRGLARALDALSSSGEFSAIASPSKRRASVEGADGTRLTLLDKSEGWVIEDVQRAKPEPKPQPAP